MKNQNQLEEEVAHPKNNVWMHAETWRCGYPGDSSDLATGAAGAVTSTPSTHRHRPDHGSRLTPAPVRPATGHPRTWRASATNTHAARSDCTVTSTPSSHRRRSDRGPRLTPGSVPAGDSGIPGVLPPAHLSVRLSPGRGVGPVSDT